MRVVATFLAVLALATAVYAEDPLEILTPLPIRKTGVIAANKQWNVSVRVVAHNEKVSGIEVQASPLQGAKGLTIDSANISVPPAITLRPGVPHDVTVTITSIEHPDTYKGFIEFYGTGGDTRRLGHLEFSIEARQQPTITPPVVQTVARTRPGRLSAFLLGKPAIAETATLAVQYVSPSGLAVQEIATRAQGTVTRQVLDNSTFGLSEQPRFTSAAGLLELPLALPLDSISPDRYVGAAFVRIADVEAPVVVPFEITVRAAPMLPIMFLAFGILIGWLVAWMEKSGNRQAGLLYKISRVESQFSEADRAVVGAELDALREQVYLADFTEADKRVDELDRRAIGLRQIDTMLSEVIAPGAPAGALALRQDLQKLRGKVLAKFDDAIAAELKALREQVIAALASPRGPVARMRGFPKAGPSPSMGVARFLSGGFTFDFYRWRAEHAAYAYIALRVLMLLALTYVGLITLYAPSATFGSNGLADYSSMLLWGIGSDIASKTLSNLPAMIPKH